MKSRVFVLALLLLIAFTSARAEIIEQILVKVNGDSSRATFRRNSRARLGR